MTSVMLSWFMLHHEYLRGYKFLSGIVRQTIRAERSKLCWYKQGIPAN